MRNPDRETVFRFKQFEVANRLSAMKVGTDGVLLGAWTEAESPARILDIGCATGVIALMMAQRFQSATVTGVEIDSTAANEAACNFVLSPWAERLQVINEDILTTTVEALGGKFDLIVCNPPFFTNGALASDIARRTARHDTSLPLDRLIEKSSSLLNPCGTLNMILPSDREIQLHEPAVLYGFELTRLTRLTTVPYKPPRRILVELTLCSDKSNATPCPLHPTAMSIHDGQGGFSAEYSNLVKNFYLHF